MRGLLGKGGGGTAQGRVQAYGLYASFPPSDQWLSKSSLKSICMLTFYNFTFYLHQSVLWNLFLSLTIGTSLFHMF